VSPGGEPERDDTGLPPVDIEIPDDARELERDVQAYRRELRAQRRSERSGRWHRSLGKDGVVLPLLACCLILALITGTLLTVFTATSDRNLYGSPGTPASPAAKPGPPPLEMVSQQQLPDATIAVDADDDGGGTVQVATLSQAMVVLVPPECACAPEFRWLAGVASAAHVPAYVIYTAATMKEVGQLVDGLNSRLRAPGGLIRLAHESDAAALLSPSAADVPGGIQPGQLTAILAAPNQQTTWVSRIDPRDSKAPLVRLLAGT